MVVGRKRDVNEYIGQKIGSWTILEDAGQDKHYAVLVKVRCDCGNERIIGLNTLVKGRSLQCKDCSQKCLMQNTTSKYKVGEVINGFKVLDYNLSNHKKHIWKGGPYKVQCIFCNKIMYKVVQSLEKIGCTCQKTDKISGKLIKPGTFALKVGDIINNNIVIEHIYKPEYNFRSTYKIECLNCHRIREISASERKKVRCKCIANKELQAFKEGDTCGDYKILEISDRRKKSNGAIMYKVQCQNCNNIAYRCAKSIKSGYCNKCHKGKNPKTRLLKHKQYEAKRQKLLKENNFVESNESSLLKKGLYIYKITNLINNKIYIGQTTSCVQKRFDEHNIHGKYNKMPIDKALFKYGKENFKVEIIDDKAKDQDELNLKEQYYIALYNSCDKKIGYNLLIGGKNHGPLSYKRKTASNVKPVIYKGIKYDSLLQLAKTLKVSHNTLRYYIKKYGNLDRYDQIPSIVNTSGYVGVVNNKHKTKIWHAQIGINHNMIHLGNYDTQKEALEARNKYIIDNGLDYPIQEYKGEIGIKTEI